MINDNSATLKTNNLYFWIIGILSVVVPVVVAILFYLPEKGSLGDFDGRFLPHLNGVLNSATAICLVAGFLFIKKGLQRYHTTAMITAFALSSLFLISYLIYHYTVPETKFGDLDHDGVVSAAEVTQAGGLRIVYFVLLASHIVLSTVVIPFVLLSIYFGLTNQFARHRKVVKWTFPVWLYVAISGVLVYLMISPYYP